MVVRFGFLLPVGSLALEWSASVKFFWRWTVCNIRKVFVWRAFESVGIIFFVSDWT